MNISKQSYVAYFRVSKQKQGRLGLGLDTQKQEVSDYLQQFGGELVAEFMLRLFIVGSVFNEK